MADSEAKNSSAERKHPKILFIRLGKDKSKDFIQNEVFKSIRKAFLEGETLESDSIKEKNSFVLSDIESRDVQDVALGEEYVGLLLKDGRVCRFKCVCSSVKSSSKSQKDSSLTEDLAFQVQSDEAYARRLQEQLNIGRSSASNPGVLEPNFRSYYPVDDSSRLLESATFPSEPTSSFASLLNSATTANLSSSENETSEANQQNHNSNVAPATDSSQQTSASNGERTQSAASSNDNTRNDMNTDPQRVTPTNTRNTSSSETTTTSQHTPSANQRSAASQAPSYTSGTHPSARLSSLADRANNNIRTTFVNSLRPQDIGSCAWAIPLPNRPHSPTVVQRTIFSTEPFLFRSARPVFVPPHVVFPGRSLYSLQEQRRLNRNFGSRSRAYFSSQNRSRGRGQGLLNEHSISSSNNVDASRRVGSSASDRTTDDADSQFLYPEIGKLEWLQTETGEELRFSHLAALHTEFILVEKSQGILYHWPYTSSASTSVAMETDSDTKGIPVYDIPKAKPSPLLEEMNLAGESVSLISAHTIRCTVVTKSGKICSFYDKYIRECNNNVLPALIQQLSHPAIHFPDLSADMVKSVDCSEFFSAIVTETGKVFWWGLLPSEERQDFKQKLSKTISSACNISVGDKVQLRQHLPGFPGALVYKSTENQGPLLARLVSHETEEGTTQTGMKIKVKKIPRSHVKSEKSSVPASKDEVLPQRVASPRQVLIQEARSSSPHTSIRNLSRSRNPVSSNSDAETWNMKEVIFLESENKVLGTVAAIDGPHVIVKVANVLASQESLRVFKVSELESVPGEAIPSTQSTSGDTPIKSSSPIYRGCLQNTPKCILDSTRSIDPSNKEVLTGFKPVSMATTSTGISVLVQNQENLKSYFLSPVIDRGNGDQVYTSTGDVSSSWGTDDASVTVDSESVLSKDAALDEIEMHLNRKESPLVGHKRRHDDIDDDENDTELSSFQGMTDAEVISLSKNYLSSSRLSYNSQHPSLHTTTGSNVVLLCDRNGCLYPRPFGTKLADPCATELPPLQCFGMSQRAGFLTSNTSKEEQTLMVLVGFREQTLIPSIQSGIVSKVQGILDMLERLNTSRVRGRGKKSSQDLHKAKRRAVQDNLGNVQEASSSKEADIQQELCHIVSQCLHERTSSNQNLLHVCCTNPAFMYNPHDDMGEADIEKLLAEYNRGQSRREGKQLPIEVEILDLLLQHPSFGPHMISMLNERDARGCTPFMLSIQCHNFRAALHILEFVGKNKGRTYNGIQVSLDNMVFPSTFNGTTPLHALGTACTENLPPDGLGNSLTVSNLPSSYTPRILLKLFQARYPSAYRATIPPMVEKTKCPRAKTPRQRLMERAEKDKGMQDGQTAPEPKKGSLNLPSTSGTGHNLRPGMRFGDTENQRIPVIGSRREAALQGMVTFSDPKELRQALKEMDKHMVSSETLAPEGGLTSLVQHVLDVRLTEVSVEESEKLEMEVGIRGNVYNVSTSSGTTKISRKTQTSDGVDERDGNSEDAVICQLFASLLSYSKMAFATNKEQETVLAFLVNNSRWIKPSHQQLQRLNKYSNKVFGSSEGPSKPVPAQSSKLPSPSEEITAEIKITGSSGSSSIESNLLAQLDEISSSFKSLVDTLASLEGRASEELPETHDMGPSGATSSDATPAPEGATGTSGDLIDFSEPSPSSPRTPDGPKDEQVPVMIQLAQNWPCVVATILGHFPDITAEGAFEGLEVEMNEGLRDIAGNATSGPSKSAPSSACDIDGFVYELLTSTNKAVLVAFVDTIIKEMNKYPDDLIIDSTRKELNEDGPNTASRVAIAVGMKFLRAVIRQMSVHLSRSGVSYVDLRSRLGATGTPTSMGGAPEQNTHAVFKARVRMIVRAYSWLGIQALVEAAEATVLPVRDGIAKAQARSSGASVNNNVPVANLFPGARYRGARPGIRVSQYDTRSGMNEPALRTAHRLPLATPSAPVLRCRGTRLATLSDDVASPAKVQSPSPSFMWAPRAHNRRGSIVDSDSDSDEDDGPFLRRVFDEDSDMDRDEGEPSSVAMAAGLNREHPYAWALDGRLTGLGDQGSNAHAHMSFSHYINNIVTPPSVHTGNCYLTRIFSRLVKETVDLLHYLSTDNSSSDAEGRPMDDLVLPVLSISSEECTSIQERVTSVFEVSWLWLARILDVVEGQLCRGKNFDTKRYLSSLQRPDDSDLAPLPRSGSPRPGASPEEYLVFLLRAHSNEHSDTLPVIDMLCYEHMVYVLDAFVYSINNWPRPDKRLDRSLSSVSSVDGEDITPPGMVNSEPGTSTAHAHTRHKQSQESEECIKFYGMDAHGRDKDGFLNKLEETLQQKSRMMVPKATWEVFTHNVGMARFKSVDESNKAAQEEAQDNGLPVAYGSLNSMPYPTPLVMNWTSDQVIDRWKIAVDLFSRLFLADGPGAERDSFLAARAGVAGRLASFRRKMMYLRESVTADTQQSGLGFGTLGGRVGTTLSISVKRSRLLEDTLRILGEMQPFHYSNFRAKFEGEEGSGPGVHRGFFAAVANALKGDEKLPADTASLLHEPGKLPEQSGFYAPKTYAYAHNTRIDSQIKNRRHKMFTAIGRFIGLSLWFNNTVPLNFSRHVIKFLLNREVTWEDLMFFNADLFEGLSRMMIDARHPMMTPEVFTSTYCCHFETSVGGTTEELIPGGSHLPVTPDNIYKYVRLYAGKVMIGCVETELRCIRNGLYDVIPTELLSPLSPEDFQLLLSGGMSDIDISKLRSVISFTNSSGCSKDILERFKRWFWSVVQKMTALQRQQLLYFCTGSAVLPVMSDRRDPEQDLSITVDVISGNTKALPMATTCGQRMSIPLYPSKRVLKKKLLQAIQCQSYGLG